jgi:hypothetical protein
MRRSNLIRKRKLSLGSMKKVDEQDLVKAILKAIHQGLNLKLEI